MRLRLLLLAACLAAGTPAQAARPKIQCVAESRSASAVARYRRLFPCPATGRIQKTCPGYVVDHVRSLCSGGPDTIGNMAWQSRRQSVAKDNWENTPGAPKRLEECLRTGDCFINWPRRCP
jgi:hypothetical protein